MSALIEHQENSAAPRDVWRNKLFYRYRVPSSDSSRERQIFEEHLIYFSSPQNFADPLEAKPRFQWGDMSWATFDYFLKLLRKREPRRTDFDHFVEAYKMFENMKSPSVRTKYIRDMERELSMRFRGSSICCFCESATNTHLWEHYADHDQGYCVGFSFDDEWTYEDPETERKIRIYPYKVTYQDEAPQVDADELETREQQDYFVEQAVLTKISKWSAECEWRCFRASVDGGLQPFPPSALRTLIFGEKMAEICREEVWNRAKGNPNIATWTISKDPNGCLELFPWTPKSGV